MIKFDDEIVWKKILESSPEIKKLAIAAGVENNPKRAEELRKYGLNDCQCEEKIFYSEAEEKLSMYLGIISELGIIEGAVQYDAALKKLSQQ